MSGKVTKGDIYHAAWAAEIGKPRLYETVLDALHAFAQAPDCPVGHSVVDWFKKRSDAANDAGRQALAALEEGEG